jgi:hypothetical protein
MIDIQTVKNGKLVAALLTFILRGLTASHGWSNSLAYKFDPDHGYLGKVKLPQTYNTMVINGKAYRIYKTVVHKFLMGDVEDPDLYAAQPLWDWQESEMGKWVMARAVDTPEWHRQPDLMQYGYQYAIVAKLKDVDYTFWILKWSGQVDKKT